MTRPWWGKWHSYSTTSPCCTTTRVAAVVAAAVIVIVATVIVVVTIVVMGGRSRSFLYGNACLGGNILTSGQGHDTL